MTPEQLAALKVVAENPNMTRAKWYAHYIPSQGWAICWKNGEDFIPIAHMRWTDGTRPQIEQRLENECKLIAAFDPSTCLALLEEVERLREQWNTRFDTLCGNCGKRYRGPRDEHLHGIGKCDQ
jgi:hypothetical protein